MIWDFSAWLLIATVVCGLIWFIDAKFFKKDRLAANSNAKEPTVVDYARSFFPILLFVFILRSFLVEPYRIPSGSMKPTLLVGDFILVNKFTYGIRLPITNTQVFELNEPVRGDVLVFRFPPNPSINFIKRVVGLPGDQIIYQDKQLFINGERVPKTLLDTLVEFNDVGQPNRVQLFTEDLQNTEHEIFEQFTPGVNISVTVPEGHYFVLGDNRDASDDSRYWGFVPEDHIIGKAFALWMSWDSNEHKVRLSRIGSKIE